jgi:nitrous oxide reductase
MTEFKLKKGDNVTLILTNLDKIEDLTHGFAIPKYNVNFIVNPQETAVGDLCGGQTRCILVLTAPTSAMLCTWKCARAHRGSLMAE